MSPARTAEDLPPYEYPKETEEKRMYLSMKNQYEYQVTNEIFSIVEYADLEALDISKLDQPGGKQALAEQVLSFINKNGSLQHGSAT